jgi:RNA polymerase sigma-70 factor (ECF subfamily)
MYAIEQLAFLAQNNFNKLVSKLARRVPNVADAEDIVQTALERGVRYANTYDENQAFDAWFGRLIQNAWKDWLKENRRAGMTDEVNEKNGGEVPCTKEAAELAELLKQEILSLPDSFKKDVMYRRFLIGLPVDEIAFVLGVDRERVKKSILRWRALVFDKYGVQLQ